MKRDEIIRMARQAGAERSCINDEVWMLALAETGFEKFAELVAAAEREACVRVLEDYERFGDTRDCAAAIRARGEK